MTLESSSDAQNPHMPLEGIRILDLSRVLAGPLCTMMLSDLGAEVLKVEGPSGDETRAWGPPWAGEMSAYFLSVNRNKQSAIVDLGSDEGIETLRRLLPSADVLVENFRPGRLDQWGLTPDILKSANPGLIHCSITGFGDDGPYRDHPGFDPVIEAMSGLMSINGPSDRQEPYKVGVAVVDVLAALYASTVIVAMIRRRDETGIGGRASIPLLDVAISSLVNVASSHLLTGETPQRYGNDHPNIAPFGLFGTKTSPIMICVGNDKQWREFRTIVALDSPNIDAFDTNEDRVARRDELRTLIEDRLKLSPASHWSRLLMDAGVPAGPVNTVTEAFQDAHVQATGLVQQVAGLNGEVVRMVGPPFRIDGKRPGIREVPPPLGSGAAALDSWLYPSNGDSDSTHDL